VISNRSRALLDRYALASRSLSRLTGERSSTETGQSVEFHDFRPYQPGDELRYVDWRVYARSGRLYTRLYQAERAVQLHLILDTSASMGLGHKARFARTLVQLLSYVAQRDAPTQLHLLDGTSSRRAQGLVSMRETWRFVEDAPTLRGAELGPISGLKRFALSLPPMSGSALAIVVSDLLEDVPMQPTLAALRARRMDVGFVQLLSADDLEPLPASLELHDVETAERLPVGPDDVRAYRAEIAAYVRRTRSAILEAGFRHLLLRLPRDGQSGDIERDAFAALVREALLVKR